MSKAEKTRQFIVEKTAPIFNMKGYAGTSLSDIAGATGLTKGSIYGNFINKDEVALAVFDYNLTTLDNKVNAKTSTGTNAIDKLLLMANFYSIEFKNVLISGGCPILNTAVEADDTHPLLKDRVSKAIKAWKKNIESIVKQGISNGEILNKANPAEFATEFIALIEGGIMLAKVTGDISMLHTAINRINTIINNELKL
ncbi:TetR/AcrR family transcriptional regulator [soil metagenome]